VEVKILGATHEAFSGILFFYPEASLWELDPKRLKNK